MCECLPPIRARIAAAAGIHETTLAKRIAAEQWDCLDFRLPAVRAAYEAGIANARAAMAGETPDAEDEPPVAVEAEDAPSALLASAADLPPADRATLMSTMLVRLGDQLLASIGAHRGSLARPQLDTVHAIIRLVEKLEPLAQERVTQEQTRSDDEIAAVLERIDDRIVELAEEHAERLGAEKSDE